MVTTDVTDAAHTTAEARIGVIGLGSRGLGVLERIITLASQESWGRRPVRVELVDPVGDGSGLHDPEQPDYLLLNTVAAQVSHFPEEATVGDAVADRGTDLYTWVTGRSLRLAEDGFTLGAFGRPVAPDDYLPRRILGEYLAWCLRRTLARAPEHVTVELHRTTAIALNEAPDGGRSITLEDGRRVEVDHVFLTTGHTPPAEPAPGPGGERYLREIYPLPGQLARIEPGQTVALGGTGLSAMDALAALTVGRGGEHVPGPDGRRCYLPSGREPRILLYSRTGLPFRARPENNRRGGYQPIAFTRQAVDRLRTDRPELDLREQVEPLILTEMRIAFHRRTAALAGGEELEAVVERALREAHAAGRIGAELDRLDREQGEFDPVELVHPPVGGTEDREAYQAWYLDRIAQDLAQARLGLAGSPVKSALEVLRDLRDVIRYAVDFGGLEEKSHEEFYGSYTGVLNRNVTGPQLDRHAELLALVEAGIVKIPFGPAPTVEWDGLGWVVSSTELATPHQEWVDWLCLATSGQPDVERTASPLLRQLRDSGRIRRHRPSAPSSRGVDVTRGNQPIGADGTVDERLWVLGPLCEGATFYNHYVPSPGGPNRALADAHRCVGDLFDRL
ncbi:FAD/NAD(P)-binding protein [Kitasatospora sp. NPDC004289]